jgi:hypothetical protein
MSHGDAHGDVHDDAHDGVLDNNCVDDDLFPYLYRFI